MLITVLGTGPESTYGPDGKAISRNPGQFRFRVTVDEATGRGDRGFVHDHQGVDRPDRRLLRRRPPGAAGLSTQEIGNIADAPGADRRPNLDERPDLWGQGRRHPGEREHAMRIP